MGAPPATMAARTWVPLRTTVSSGWARQTTRATRSAFEDRRAARATASKKTWLNDSMAMPNRPVPMSGKATLSRPCSAARSRMSSTQARIASRWAACSPPLSGANTRGAWKPAWKMRRPSGPLVSTTVPGSNSAPSVHASSSTWKRGHRAASCADTDGPQRARTKSVCSLLTQAASGAARRSPWRTSSVVPPSDQRQLPSEPLTGTSLRRARGPTSTDPHAPGAVLPARSPDNLRIRLSARSHRLRLLRV